MHVYILDTHKVYWRSSCRMKEIFTLSIFEYTVHISCSPHRCDWCVISQWLVCVSDMRMVCDCCVFVGWLVSNWCWVTDVLHICMVQYVSGVRLMGDWSDVQRGVWCAIDVWCAMDGWFVFRLWLVDDWFSVGVWLVFGVQMVCDWNVCLVCS